MLLVFLGLALALLQTAPGKSALVTILESAIRIPGEHRIAIGSITGSVPTNMQIESLTLSDNESTWLSSENIVIRLNVAALLSKRIHLRLFSVDRVTLHRIPEFDTEESTQPWSAPELPSFPPWLQINEARIGQFIIDDAVADESGTFTVALRYELGESINQVTLESSIQRLDNDSTSAHLNVYRSDSELRLDASVVDSVYLPAQLGTDEPVQIALDAEGPFSNWDAHLTGSIGSRPFVDLSALIRGDVDSDFELNGFFDLSMLPSLDSVSEQLGPKLELTLDGSLDGGGLLNVENGLAESERITVELSGSTHLETRSVSGDLSLRYADLSLLIGGLERESKIPVALDAKVEGNWDNITATIHGTVDDEDTVDADLILRFENLIALNAHGTLLVPKSFYPDSDIPILEEEVNFVFGFAYDQLDGAYRVDTLQLENEQVVIEGTLDARPEEQFIEAQLTLEIEDPETVETLVASDFSASGNAQLIVTSTGDATIVELKAELSDVVADTVKTDAVRVHAEFHGGSWPDDYLTDAAATARIDSDAVRMDDQSLPPIEIDLALNREDGGVVEVTRLSLTQGKATVTASGQFDTEFESATMKSSISIPDAKPYSALAQTDIKGRIQAVIDGAYEATDEGRVSGKVSGNLTGFSGANKFADALLLNKVEVRSGYTYTNDTLMLQSITLTSRDWNFSGEGSYDLEKSVGTTSADLQITSAELVSKLTDSPLQAQGSIGITGSGSTEDFAATATLNDIEGSYDSLEFNELTAKFEAGGATGNVLVNASLALNLGDERIEGDATVRVQDERIEFPTVALRAGENTVSGSGHWASTNNSGASQVTFDLPELESIGRLFDEELSGSGKGEITLSSENDVVSIDTNIEVEQLISSYAQASRLHVSGQLHNILDAPTGTTSADLESVNVGDTMLDSSSLVAAFEGNTIKFELRTEGMIAETVPIDLTADASLDSTYSRLALTTFSGSIDRTPFSLTKPAVLSREDGVFSVQDFSSSVGKGSIETAGTYSDDSIHLDLAWDALPLSIVTTMDGWIPEGQTNGSLSLRGSPRTPTGELSLDIREARTSTMVAANLGGANLHLEGALNPESLVLQSNLSIAGNSTAHITASLPLEPSDESIYAIDSGAPWTGRIEGRIALADIPPLLDTDTHLLDGQLEILADLSGSQRSPLVDATLTTKSARYENAFLGTLLQDIQLDISGTKDKLQLNRFTANDGLGGTVDAKGDLTLGEELRFDYTVALDINEARLVHRDDITGKMNGKLTLAGDENASLLSGKAEVTQANYIVRPTKKQSVPKLDVVYVNAETPNEVIEQPKTNPIKHEFRYDLDIAFPGRTFIQASDVFTEWKGEVTLGGTSDELLVTGEIEPVRGHVSFLGRRFTLDRESTVVINTETSEAPYLNILATTRRDGIDGILRIQGSLQELTFSLSSNPPLPQEEILARVLFGRNVSDMTPIQGLQLARALAMMSGTFEGMPFFSGPSRLPLVDTVDFQMGEEGPTVGVGKYVSDRIFVELQQGNGAETNRFKVQIDATQHIAVESDVGANNQAGLGVFFKFNY